MFYWIGLVIGNYWIPAFNVVTWITLRSALAAITAFLLGIVIGPWWIRWLRRQGVSASLRDKTFFDLHDRHQQKAGTPTMGGALIVTTIVLSVLLWSNLTTRLVWLVLFLTVGFATLGALDDLSKLRKGHYKGLSARQKLLGQILLAAVAGLYLYWFPSSTMYSIGTPALRSEEILDWHHLCQQLTQTPPVENRASGRIGQLLPPAARETARLVATNNQITAEQSDLLIKALNDVLRYRDLYQPEDFDGLGLAPELVQQVEFPQEPYSSRELLKINRQLFEATFPQSLARSQARELSAKRVGAGTLIPFFKDSWLYLGGGYILFVVIVIVATSNAVNLADGLDGLAIGCTLIAVTPFAIICYLQGRWDYSEFLILPHVPGAGELAVFCAAVLGSSMAFLWFNCHPAEVFMGDTGSLSLGSALGVIAVLLKQEFLLVVIGGIFVAEALSVLIQVASYKTTGKRVFLMSPLHHHFEKLGWHESRVIIRFWIVAAILGMAGLAMLKLR